MKTVWVHNNNQITDCLKNRSSEMFEMENGQRDEMFFAVKNNKANEGGVSEFVDP